MPVCNLYVLPWTLFVIKSNFDLWKPNNVTSAKIWLFIEIIHYLNYLISIGVFLALIYIFKLKTINKDLAELLLDDNVWNDNNTFDILGVLKPEAYQFCYLLSFMITNI